jgi:pimeloyl-ACP methyl ester carboxylesterase
MMVAETAIRGAFRSRENWLAGNSDHRAGRTVIRMVIIAMMVLSAIPCSAQFDPSLLDTTLNNLILAPGYSTCRLGELGNVRRYGNGSQSMILIAGWGFDAGVYDDFMKDNGSEYTMYAVTPAGFGGTPAPPMPDTSVPYSRMTWTNGIVMGVLDLIEKEHLKKPVIVGHFTTGAQAALQLALDHPDRISKCIILGGAPYRYFRPRADTVWGTEQHFTPAQRERVTGMLANIWFKSVPVTTWNDGNHRPEEYAIDPVTGRELFARSAAVPIPVMVRYLLEHIAYDPTPLIGGLNVPVLALVPSFSEEFFKSTYRSLNQTMTREWIRYYFQETWNTERGASPLLHIQMIPDSRYFIWKDNPRAVYRAIREFVSGS